MLSRGMAMARDSHVHMAEHGRQFGSGDYAGAVFSAQPHPGVCRGAKWRPLRSLVNEKAVIRAAAEAARRYMLFCAAVCPWAQSLKVPPGKSARRIRNLTRKITGTTFAELHRRPLLHSRGRPSFQGLCRHRKV